jgi:hypothetical protein
MARDLDTLIREAKAQESASLVDRGRVREALAQRIASEPLQPNAAAANRLPIVGASVVGVAAAVGLAIAIGSGFGAKLQASGYEPPPRVHEQQRSDVDAAPAVMPAEPSAPAVPAPGAPEQPDLLAQPLVPAEPQAAPPVEPDPQAEPLARANPVAPSERRSPRRKPPPPPRFDFTDLTPLERESRYLAETERYLRQGGVPALVLSMLMQQDRTFSKGILQAERDALRVLALCASQREQEAKEKADAFLREYPTSPLRARVLGSCVKAKSKASSP